MKKILLSLSMITVVAVAAVGATGAFFSDTETSTGNTFTAGAIDLGIDNHSYYNGVLNPGTTWRVDYDLSKNEQGQPEAHQFFNFGDLKPGDWGEDTISLHVKDNDSYLCADVKLTSNNDNGLTEPEGNDGDTTPGAGEGELANAVNFYWWADDGDNVFESDEHLLPAGPLGALHVGETATVALADSQTNIWGDSDAVPGNGAPLPGDTVRFVAKAWCFGGATMTPYQQDGGNQQNGPDHRPVVCSGANENNITQTDSMTADITFRAVQSRNNSGFVCSQPQTEPRRLVLDNEIINPAGPWETTPSDNIGGLLTWAGDGPTFDYSVTAHGLAANTNYSLIYYADPWAGNNPGAFIGAGTTDSSGNLSFAGNPNLGVDLPTLPDTNIADHGGAKIWLVTSADYNSGSSSTGPMTGWNPSQYLFEGNVYINYNDTNN